MDVARVADVAVGLSGSCAVGDWFGSSVDTGSVVVVVAVDVVFL